MKVLILGSGAREHALAWKFSKSNRLTGLFIGPGNAGCGEIGTLISDLDPCNAKQVLEVCRNKHIDLVFVGNEAPLEAGIADALESAGIAVVGPKKASARLESSKVFSKEFMVKNQVPTALAKHFKDKKAFEEFISGIERKWVVKKSGLAAGKGVLESKDKAELLEFGRSILKDDELLVEEFLTGFEVSVFVLSDGKNYKVLPPCADFKKAKEGDQGRNTGGMGAICPVPTVTSELWEEIQKEVVETTMAGLNKEGINFKGVLFIGVMVTDQGPKVLEYNVRFGDPEAQVLLPLIKSDFANLCEAIIQGSLDQFHFQISDQSALGVVVASPGYPGNYEKNLPVTKMPETVSKKNKVFHASTKRDLDGTLKTTGGRCFTCVGIGESFKVARERAYKTAQNLNFKGAWFRKDIGEKFFLG
jgi:phosphoribosylamine--glycine ligase